jgi:hypothetical protein
MEICKNICWALLFLSISSLIAFIIAYSIVDHKLWIGILVSAISVLVFSILLGVFYDGC